METQNLWPDFPVEAAKSPKSILKEQAGYLMFKTNNVLSADVVAGQGLSDQIIYDFHIVAPAINNYRYHLLCVVQKLFFYPLEISANASKYEVKNQEEFIIKLSEIFNDPVTIRVISSLLAQSLAE